MRNFHTKQRFAYLRSAVQKKKKNKKPRRDFAYFLTAPLPNEGDIGHASLVPRRISAIFPSLSMYVIEFFLHTRFEKTDPEVVYRAQKSRKKKQNKNV